MVWNDSTIRQIGKREGQTIYEVAKVIIAISEWNSDPAHAKKKLNFECHSICMVLAKFIPNLTVVHGCYCGARQRWRKGKLVDWKLETIDHTWLRTSRGNIIDPHPVAIIAGKPLVVIGRGKDAPFGSGLYVRGRIARKRYDNRKVRGRIRRLSAFLNRRKKNLARAKG